MVRRRRRRGTRSIGVASRKCRMIDRRTGKRIRTKAERKRCMRRALKGGPTRRRKRRRRRRRR